MNVIYILHLFILGTNEFLCAFTQCPSYAVHMIVMFQGTFIIEATNTKYPN